MLFVLLRVSQLHTYCQFLALLVLYAFFKENPKLFAQKEAKETVCLSDT